MMEMDGGAVPTRMSPEELQEFLSSIFIEADQDNSGTLSYKEFKEVRATPPTTPIPSTTLGVGAWVAFRGRNSPVAWRAR